MRIDPRDFIMTPYLQCPKCGKQEFGVLNVSDTRCQRRCRACLHVGTQYLPAIRKTVVYIDQFAFSNIMKLLSPELKGHERAASDPFWKELFEILTVVDHIQRVACPDSREHHNESLASPFGELLKRTYEHFSGGVSFVDSESIKARQIAQIARCWLKSEPASFDFDAEGITSGRIHAWSGRLYVTAGGILPGTVENLRESRDAVHARLKEVFKQWQKEKKSFQDV